MNRLLNFRSRFFWGVVLPLVAIFCLAQVRLSWAQPAPPAESAPRFKAIWEPANYKEDLNLTDVFFATDQVGWVTGEHGTVLYTKDGGDTWTPQLGGDPQSQEAPISHLQFLDETHGWAWQGGKLLRTTDGENWETIGALPEYTGYTDYRFTSRTDGIALVIRWEVSRYIWRTQDSGKTWQQVGECKTKMQVEGLMRDVDAWLLSVHFPSPSVGYAVGGHPMCSGCGGPPLVMKTKDGGATWSISVGPGDVKLSTLDKVFFIDETTGFAHTAGDRKLYTTTDGGQTWRGLVGAPGADIKFADPAVAWAFAGSTLSYTTDGGKRWFSRDFRFPAGVRGFSLPRRDRAYVVGEHGMIYRYRIVPIDYQVANMLDAPMMPGLTTPLDGTVANIREEAQALQAKLEAAEAKPAASARSPNSSADVPPALEAAQPAPATSPSPVNIQLAANSRAANPPEAGGQSAGTPAQEAPAATATGGQAEGGFAQDVGNAPLSPPIQECCAAEVQGLQTGVGSFLHEVPAFSTNWRPLNLIIAGLRLATDLLNKAQGVRSAFLAIKTAKSLPEASAALQTMMTNLEGASQTIASRFQNTQTVTWPQAPVSAAGAVSAVAGAVAPGASQPAAAPGSTQPAGIAEGAKPGETKKTNPTAEEIKNKLKKKFGIKFP